MSAARIKPQEKGHIFEAQIAEVVPEIFGNIALRNVLIAKDEKDIIKTEIDLVVPTTKGIFLLECKYRENHKDTIQGELFGEWVNHGGRNPALQNESHRYVFDKFLVEKAGFQWDELHTQSVLCTNFKFDLMYFGKHKESPITTAGTPPTIIADMSAFGIKKKLKALVDAMPDVYGTDMVEKLTEYIGTYQGTEEELLDRSDMLETEGHYGS